MVVIVATRRRRRQRRRRGQEMDWNHKRVIVMSIVVVVVVVIATGIVGSYCEYECGAPSRHSPRSGRTTIRSRRRRRLKSLLPNDLNVMQSERLMGALGIQLLLFAGWIKVPSSNHKSTLFSILLCGHHRHHDVWKRDDTTVPLSLEDRWHRITPTFKSGGTVDYHSSHDSSAHPSSSSSSRRTQTLFQDDTTTTTHPLLFQGMTTVEEVSEALEHMGVSIQDDFEDVACQTALQAMLSWTFPPSPSLLVSTTTTMSSITALLVFSFDATQMCRSMEDCPYPGPTNELLAATALRFATAHHHDNDETQGRTLRIVAQWEVAAAIQNHPPNHYAAHDNAGTIWNVTAVGTPGTFQSTVDILDLMICELQRQPHHATTTDHDDSTQHTTATTTPMNVVVLAHPDHLRRILWTAAQSRTHSIRQTSRTADPSNHTNKQDAKPSSCHIKFIPAMQPYNLEWPTLRKKVKRTMEDDFQPPPQQQQQESSSWNLFDGYDDSISSSSTTLVHTQGNAVWTHWYDPHYFGFFPDGDPQKWTHDRLVWILYDHWAMAKGIATGIIDPSMGILPPVLQPHPTHSSANDKE